MKTDVRRSSIVFSDDEMFEGKKVYGRGDWTMNRRNDSFWLDASTLCWARDGTEADGKNINLVCTEHIDEDKKSVLLPYIKKHARISIMEW